MMWNDDAIRARFQAAAFRGTIKGAVAVQLEALRLIFHTSKTGRVYRRRGVSHRASAPGEAPASDTGQLAQSGNIRPDQGATLTRLIFNKVYARPLELGSSYKIRGGGGEDQNFDPLQREFGTQKLEPRPFLRPALYNMQVRIMNEIVSEIRAEFGFTGTEWFADRQGSLF